MRVKLALGALFLAAALVSLLWWRNDADGCACEYCPDGFCVYGDRIAAVLANRDRASLAALRLFGREYTHSHSPLAPIAIGALEAAALPRQPVVAFALVNLAFGWLAWVGIRRIAASLELPSPVPEAALFVAFFTQFLVVRALARPSTDLLGMALAVWVLDASGRQLAAPSRKRGFALAGLEALSQLSRVSCLPLLGLPALAALVQDLPIAERIRGAIRSGVLFGVLPGALVFGALRAFGFENLEEAWRFGHSPGFVAEYTGHNFVFGVLLAGQAYLAVALVSCALWRPVARHPIVRLHLAWIALYLAYLALGRTALFPRYFLPIVPSCVLVAAPAMGRLGRSRPALLWIALLLLAAANGFRIARVTRDPNLAPAARLLWHDLRESAVGRAIVERDAHVSPENLAPGPALARAPRPTIDGDVDTRWSARGSQAAGMSFTVDLVQPEVVRSLSLWSPADAYPRDFLVEGRQGDTWITLAERAGAEATSGFFDQRSHTDVALDPELVSALRIRLLEGSPAPWSIDELRVEIAP